MNFAATIEANNSTVPCVCSLNGLNKLPIPCIKELHLTNYNNELKPLWEPAVLI